MPLNTTEKEKVITLTGEGFVHLFLLYKLTNILTHLCDIEKLISEDHSQHEYTIWDLFSF